MTPLNLPPVVSQREWEAREDSRAGYPQTKAYEWWRRQDEYEAPSY